jgi:hypothetical protein
MCGRKQGRRFFATKGNEENKDGNWWWTLTLILTFSPREKEQRQQDFR